MSTGQLRLLGGGSDGLKLSATQDVSGVYSITNTNLRGHINLTDIDISTFTQMVEIVCPVVGGKIRPLSVFNVTMNSILNDSLRVKVILDDKVLYDYTGTSTSTSAAISQISNLELTRWRVEKSLKIEAYQSAQTDATLNLEYQILED